MEQKKKKIIIISWSSWHIVYILLTKAILFYITSVPHNSGHISFSDFKPPCQQSLWPEVFSGYPVYLYVYVCQSAPFLWTHHLRKAAQMSTLSQRLDCLDFQLFSILYKPCWLYRGVCVFVNSQVNWKEINWQLFFKIDSTFQSFFK